jgi:glycine cleavage system aminomethyltransferase T
MDMSFMSKQLVQGRDAGKVLNWISGGDVDGPSETVTYTQWLNARGTLEADLTVTKLTDEKFIVVASDTAHRHVESWLHRHIGGDDHCFATDVTSGFAQINIQGPRSRELLQTLTTVDLSNEAFPFRTAREIDIGFARVLLLRITYLGELGYELYIPTEHCADVYERLVEAGKAVDLKHAGLKSLASLRMEKGYRDYGHDIDNTDSILNVGLGFALDLEQGGRLPRQGGGAGQEGRSSTPTPAACARACLQVLVKDPEPLMFHGEVVYRDGEAKGYVRAASVRSHPRAAPWASPTSSTSEPYKKDVDRRPASWEVDIAGTRYPAVASVAAALRSPRTSASRCRAARAHGVRYAFDMEWNRPARLLLLSCLVAIAAGSVALGTASCNADPGCCCAGDAVTYPDALLRCPDDMVRYSTETCNEVGGPCMLPLLDCYADADCAEGSSCIDNECEADPDLLSDAGVEDAGVEDAGVEDAGGGDAGVEDAGMEDAGGGDAGG